MYQHKWRGQTRIHFNSGKKKPKPTSLRSWTSKLPSVTHSPKRAIRFLFILSLNTCSVLKQLWLRIIRDNIWKHAHGTFPDTEILLKFDQSCSGGAVCTTGACFLSCFVLPLQSPTAGCGDFEILSILNPPEWYILQVRHDASETISHSDLREKERKREREGILEVLAKT